LLNKNVYKKIYYFKSMEYKTDNSSNQQADFEIGDVESYGTQRDSAFSHQVLVMLAMKKALENGAREMRSGWFE
jgi:hypothetical protein